MQRDVPYVKLATLESTNGLSTTPSALRYPAIFVRKASRKISAVIRLVCWRVLQPKMILSSGLVLNVKSDSDWEIAKEIFIDRDYDDAIEQVFLSADCVDALRIMDLGANVGGFSLRCIDLHLQAKNPFRLELFAIEGVPSLSAELRQRLSKCSQENVTLVVKAGLVGRQTGKAMIHSSVFHSCTNSVVRSGTRVSKNRLLDRHAEESQYVDLGQMIDPDVTVDLIKCDIEGSELDFLLAYEDLLRRTRFLIIEFHPRLCDVDGCRELLNSYGFCNLRTIKDHPTHSLHLYRREQLLASDSSRPPFPI